MTPRDLPDFPIALIVDTSESAAGYLSALERTAGLRWVLTHNFDAYRLLLHELTGKVGLVVLDFEHALTDKLRYYLEVVRLDKSSEVPVIFLPAKGTEERAQRVRERPVDQILVRPFDQDALETLMGSLLGSSVRKKISLKFWIFLESRTIEGMTDNLSGSGMGGNIPDPILFSHVHLRLFAPDDKAHIDIYGHVRRKQREAEGGYALGVEFERVLEGDVRSFSRLVNIDFSGLKDAGEETRTTIPTLREKLSGAPDS